MKAFLVLADAASSHPDGTFSLLRGGITEVNVQPNTPALFKGALVVRIVAGRGEAGHHGFKIRLVTEDGGSIVPDTGGAFEVPDRGGNVSIVMDMQMIFPKFGRYEFSIQVDNVQQDVWPIEVREAKAVQSDKQH